MRGKRNYDTVYGFKMAAKGYGAPLSFDVAGGRPLEANAPIMIETYKQNGKMSEVGFKDDMGNVHYVPFLDKKANAKWASFEDESAVAMSLVLQGEPNADGVYPSACVVVFVFEPVAMYDADEYRDYIIAPCNALALEMGIATPYTRMDYIRCNVRGGRHFKDEGRERTYLARQTRGILITLSTMVGNTEPPRNLTVHATYNPWFIW